MVYFPGRVLSGRVKCAAHSSATPAEKLGPQTQPWPRSTPRTPPSCRLAEGRTWARGTGSRSRTGAGRQQHSGFIHRPLAASPRQQSPHPGPERVRHEYRATHGPGECSGAPWRQGVGGDTGCNRTGCRGPAARARSAVGARACQKERGAGHVRGGDPGRGSQSRWGRGRARSAVPGWGGQGVGPEPRAWEEGLPGLGLLSGTRSAGARAVAWLSRETQIWSSRALETKWAVCRPFSTCRDTMFPFQISELNNLKPRLKDKY